MPVAAVVAAAACVATINCHNFFAAILRWATFTDCFHLSPPPPTPFSLSKKRALNIVARKFRLSLRQSCRLWNCIGWLS